MAGIGVQVRIKSGTLAVTLSRLPNDLAALINSKLANFAEVLRDRLIRATPNQTGAGVGGLPSKAREYMPNSHWRPHQDGSKTLAESYEIIGPGVSGSTVSVSVVNTAPYARVQELGGSPPPHDVRLKMAKAFAFMGFKFAEESTLKGSSGAALGDMDVPQGYVSQLADIASMMVSAGIVIRGSVGTPGEIHSTGGGAIAGKHFVKNTLAEMRYELIDLISQAIHEAARARGLR